LEVINMSGWYPNNSRVWDNGFGASRNGNTIKGVVIHHVAGTNGLSYVANKNSRNSHPTYHIATSGAVTGIVNPERRPFSTAHAVDLQAVTFEIDNSSAGGNWPVSDEAIESLINVIVWHASHSPRAGKGMARNIPGQTQEEFFIAWHSQYAATACPGPHIMSLMDYIVSESTKRAAGTAPTAPAPAAPATAPAQAAPATSVDALAREVLAGQWGTGPTRVSRLGAAGHDARAVQAMVNQILSGKAAAPSAPARPAQNNSVDVIAREVIDGKWGNGAVRISRLKRARHDVRAVQAAVNAILAGGSPAPAPAPAQSNSVDRVAREVIDGKWGNGPTRVSKLGAAGHDVRAVQSRVNAILAGR
jgi:hypothetical protein